MTDAVTFMRNCNAHSDEEMAKYIGYNVAWSEDGTQILSHALDVGDLISEMEKRGTKDYVIQYFPQFCPELAAGLPVELPSHAEIT
jgi:hypothetical protein